MAAAVGDVAEAAFPRLHPEGEEVAADLDRARMSIVLAVRHRVPSHHHAAVAAAAAEADTGAARGHHTHRGHHHLARVLVAMAVGIAA